MDLNYINSTNELISYNEPHLIQEKFANSIISNNMYVGDSEFKTRLIKKISSGSFGEVYIGKMESKNQLVAIKFESQNTRILPTLMNEGRFYRTFNEKMERLPILYWFGYYCSTEYAAMIMELLGPSLNDLWLKCGQEFSLKTLLIVILETLTCLNIFHSNNCVHRDISPNNFAIGYGKKSKIFHIFDFGNALKLTKSSFNYRPRVLMKFNQNNNSIIGTPRFISIFTHLDQPPSYRDDMEALGYMWVYLFKGRLPWQSIRIKMKDFRMEQIKRKKLETSIEDLCDGMPEEFNTYMKYVRSLGHMEMPNHSWAKELFINLASRSNIIFDGSYDWE